MRLRDLRQQFFDLAEDTEDLLQFLKRFGAWNYRKASSHWMREGSYAEDEDTGGLGIELRKDAIRTPTLLSWWKAKRRGAISRVPRRSCVVVDPRHVWKLHARETGDLGDACCCLTGSRTAGEGSGRTTRMYVAE